jgi:hypothetical protein
VAIIKIDWIQHLKENFRLQKKYYEKEVAFNFPCHFGYLPLKKPTVQAPNENTKTQWKDRSLNYGKEKMSIKFIIVV